MADVPTTAGNDPEPRRRPLRDLERAATEIDGDDELTRRETLETELIEEGRSHEGEQVDLERDVGPGTDTPAP
jgi:hypothetical protein